MSEGSMPAVEEQRKGSAWQRRDASLFTLLGLVAGDVLVYLEAHGATTLRGLIRQLEWSSPMVMMAAGALTREGLVRSTQHNLEVIVEPLTNRKPIPSV